MYAIIKSGGKQYRVEKGKHVQVEKLGGAPGETVFFDEVVMIKKDGDTLIGNPYVEGARVEAEIVDQGRGKKIEVFKFIRRRGYHKKQGHRQSYTNVLVRQIHLP